MDRGDFAALSWKISRRRIAIAAASRRLSRGAMQRERGCGPRAVGRRAGLKRLAEQARELRDPEC